MITSSSRRRTAALLGGAAMGLVLAALPGGPAHAAQPAAEAPAARTYAIPAGPLAAALTRFSEQSGLQLVYDAAAVRDLNSPGVQGQLTAEAALVGLLAGSGLGHSFVNAATVTLIPPTPDGGRVLGPVRVEAAEAAYGGPPQRGEGVAQLGGVRGGQDQEERGLRPVIAAVGAGAPTALEDIPRAVSVLTQTQMQAQDIQDIGEAIRRLPGLTMIDRTSSTGSSAAEGGGQIYARGFAVTNVQIDGGAPRFIDIINNGLLNLNAYERVELVRGPNGVFAGEYSPGGSLNLVRKRPGVAPSLGVTASLGSYDRYQLSVDASTPSLFGTPFAFRAVVSYDDQKFAWDNDHLKRAMLYGVVDAPLGDRARFELGGQYSTTKQNGFYQGSYRYYDGPRLGLPFYFNYTPEWSFLKSDNVELFGRFYVRMLENWNFDIGGTYFASKKRSLDSVINGMVYLLSETNQAYRFCRPNGVCFPYETSFFSREYYDHSPEERLAVDFRITGKFDTLWLKHNLYIAGDVSETVSPGYKGQQAKWDPSWPIIYSLDDFANLPNFAKPTISDSVPDSALIRKLNASSSSSMGLVITDTISLLGRIFLNLSVRRQDQETSQASVGLHRDAGWRPYSIGLGEEGDSPSDSKAAWRPTWSLSFKPLRDMTVYGSHSEGSNDQSRYQTLDGGALGPMTYKNAELGAKYGRWGWLLQVSGYRLVQDNIASAIPDSRGRCGPTPTSYCYFRGGDSIKSKGFDFEFSGRLFDQLDLQLSYNYSDAKRISENMPVSDQLPTKMGKFFVNWDPKFLPRWSFNAGAVYRGRIFEAGTRTRYDPATGRVIEEIPFEYEEPSHLIVDLGADFRLSDRLSLNLLVENLSDKQYYSTVSNYVNHVGNPRTALLRVRWRPTGAPSGLLVSPTTGLSPFGDPADWYGAVDFGGHASSNLTAASEGKMADGQPVTWTFKTKASPAWSARIGYRLKASWRGELEVGWKMTDFTSIGGSDRIPFGVCGVAYASSGVDTSSSCKKPQGEATYWSFMANAIRDFGREDALLRPFVGAGIGLTRSSVDFSGRLDGYTDTVFRNWYLQKNGFPIEEAPYGGPYAPGEKMYGGDVKWGLSWQALAGLSLKITDRARIDATYKYSRSRMNMRAVNVQDYPADYYDPVILPGAGLPPLEGFKGSVSSHALTIGLRWAFGAR